MELLSRINKYLNMVLTLTGGMFLVGMILLTCANIFVRQIFVPIPGTFELMDMPGPWSRPLPWLHPVHQRPHQRGCAGECLSQTAQARHFHDQSMGCAACFSAWPPGK